MINGNNQYWQNAAMNIRKDGDEWRLAKDTVSNTYTSEDEGKVVSDGELVAQTAYPTEITENNTYDTTNYNSITVNVSGGGGNVVAYFNMNNNGYLYYLEDSNNVIGDEAFDGFSELTSITIPNSVTSIGDDAFYNCQALSSITIPNSVTSIGDYAFYNCYALEIVTFEANSSLESIGDSAFDSCPFVSITIPNSVTSIGDGVFSACQALETVTFEPTTPPTLDGDLGIDTTCTIRVPQGTLSDYTSASNYPDPSEYTYEEY